MEVWTPADRNNFLKEAVYSSASRGHRGQYHFNVYPKSNGQSSNEDHEQKRSLMTDTFARIIYQKNPKYKYISIGFYYALIEKIRTNIKIGYMLWRDIHIIIKGANVYAYLTQDFDTFPFSDLDIVIYINPNLEDSEFENIKRELRIIVLQSLSHHKRLLDNMFFVNGNNKFKDSEMYQQSKLFDDDIIEEFKEDFKEAVLKLCTTEKLIISPFEDDAIRNSCSRYSFILTNSENNQENIVRVEVPHYDRCENIPLKKSPFFCSYNETINFKRDGLDLDGKFDLYRIRFNSLFVEMEDGKTIHEEKIAADFIDVSIASKSDAELVDFWNTARCEYIIDPDISNWKIYRENKWDNITCWLIMPNIATCINDLYKMLNVYECPENKKQKREIRYKTLKRIAGL